MQVEALINSLKNTDNPTRTIEIIPETFKKSSVGLYNGRKYTALFNPFNGCVYLDDLYGDIERITEAEAEVERTCNLNITKSVVLWIDPSSNNAWDSIYWNEFDTVTEALDYFKSLNLVFYSDGLDRKDYIYLVSINERIPGSKWFRRVLETHDGERWKMGKPDIKIDSYGLPKITRSLIEHFQRRGNEYRSL